MKKDRVISLASLEQQSGIVLRLNLGEYPYDVVVPIERSCEILRLIALTSRVSVFINDHYQYEDPLSATEIEGLQKFLSVDFWTELPSCLLLQLLKLSNVKVSTKVRMTHSSLEEEVVACLLRDPSIAVRDSLARYRTASKVLTSLASDPNSQVRLSLAHNIHTPMPALLLLAKGKDELVHLALASRNTIPLPVLRILAEHPSPTVVVRVISHPYCSTAILQELVNHPYEMVRLAVARKTRAPVEVLQKLVIDPSPQVSTTALNNLTSQT